MISSSQRLEIVPHFSQHYTKQSYRNALNSDCIATELRQVTIMKHCWLLDWSHSRASGNEQNDQRFITVNSIALHIIQWHMCNCKLYAVQNCYDCDHSDGQIRTWSHTFESIRISLILLELPNLKRQNSTTREKRLRRRSTKLKAIMESSI